MAKKLDPANLRRHYRTQELQELMQNGYVANSTIIGQPRAVKALKTGLGIKSKGFNIYVSGYPGTGKQTAVNHFLQELAKNEERPSDWCYVHNFREAYNPLALKMPSGQAREFSQKVATLIEEIKSSLQKSFESDAYADAKEGIISEFEATRNEMFKKVNIHAQKEGLLIKESPIGVVIVPVKDGKALENKDYEELGEKEKERIKVKQQELNTLLKNVAREARVLEKKANEELLKLQQKTALFAIDELVRELIEEYAHLEDIKSYLEAMRKDILENVLQFLKTENQAENPQGDNLLGIPGDPFKKYKVNVFIDNQELKGSPVVLEQNPTHNNLFGKVEKESYMGTLVTDFTLIRPGALHKSNGGYLIVPMEDLLKNPFSWDGLKRAIKAKQIEIEDSSERYGFFTAKSLRPQAIPLNTQVILIGNPEFYHLLFQYDDEFRQLFKIKAEFDTEMEINAETLHQYAGFMCRFCEEENTLKLNTAALGKILEYSSRLTDNQNKLSGHFSEITDVIREAGYYAEQEDRPEVGAEQITMAIEQNYYRSDLYHEKIKEMIAQNTIAIDVEGMKTGQINGLSVADLGDIQIGRPTRITASISLGESGVIDIERESKMSGSIHTKGVLILSGYLAATFAADFPASFSASLVFEQSYGRIDGDSASSAELYTLLSALSGIPLHQGIAVTGSVNQRGQIQAIGGVNEKIEGFFEICEIKGLNGKQGVLIPASNLENLVLKDKVVEAVEKGSFHIWAVSHIEEGIELLTGVKAGIKGKDGQYPEGTVYSGVDEKLRDMANILKDFSSDPEEEDEVAKSDPEK